MLFRSIWRRVEAAGSDGKIKGSLARGTDISSGLTTIYCGILHKISQYIVIYPNKDILAAYPISTPIRANQ